MSTATLTVASPWKGLAPFEDTELDAMLFFGRDREQQVIASNLIASRLTVLYGPSGVGKTSLLRAGVAVRLRRQADTSRGRPDLAVVLFDDWRRDPQAALLEAVERELEHRLGARDLPLPGADTTLADVFARWTDELECDLLLVLDQLEEYFVYRADESADEPFAEQLAELVTRRGLRVNVLLSLREDTLAKLDRFKRRIPGLLSNYLRLDRLSPHAARDAVLRPLERYNDLAGREHAVAIEPALVDAVIDQTTAGPPARTRGSDARPNGSRAGGVDPAYLQLVLARVWEVERERGSRTLRAATLATLGGGRAVVRNHVRRALDGLGGDERDVAATLFNHLVTPSGTKIAHALGDLERYADAPGVDVAELVRALVRTRIVRPVAVAGSAEGYEIHHDVLAEPLLAWRDEHSERRRLEDERRSAAHRQRALTAAAAAALAVAVLTAAVAAYALSQRSAADREARTALARALTARALADLDVDPERAMLLAVEAARTEPSDAAENALRRALILSRVRGVPADEGELRPRDRLRASTPGLAAIALGAEVEVRREGRRPIRLDVFDGPSVSAVAVHPSGLVAAGGSNGLVRLFEADGRRLHELVGHDAPVLDLRFSPDGERLASAGVDGTARIWSVVKGVQIATLFGHANFVTAVAFSSDGTLLATASRDRGVRIWHGENGTPFRVLAGQHRASIVEVAYRPGSTRLVTRAADGSLREWEGAGDPRSHASARAGPQANGPIAVHGTTRATASASRVRLSGGTELRGHRGRVTSVSFSRDGRLVLTASVDTDARIWAARTGRHVRLLRGHFGPLADASFSPDGRWVVTAGPLAAGVWEAATGRLLFFVRGNDARLTAAGWRGPQTIVTAEEGGRVREYRCEVCTGLTGLLDQAEQRRRLTGRVLSSAERRP